MVCPAGLSKRKDFSNSYIACGSGNFHHFEDYRILQFLNIYRFEIEKVAAVNYDPSEFVSLAVDMYAYGRNAYAFETNSLGS